MDASGIESAERIHNLFRGSGMKLSVAESCTGGLVGHLLTNIPGASLFFDTSVVSYSNESKIGLLGVKASVIKKHGAVSEEVARAMAVGVRTRRGTDFSLSITGNLGPEPMEEKPVGLVYMAVDWKRDTASKGMMFRGTREEIKYEAALSALRFLGEVAGTWK